MAARAIWKGVIRFDPVRLPVRLFSAVQDQSIHFRLLHAKDSVPIKQQMVNPETGRVVPHDAMKRGYEVERGVFVVLEKSELEELAPDESRDIEITRFVDPKLINHQWYERPYWLGPDDGSERTYGELAAALEKKGMEGVARWVMRKKEYAGALRAEHGRLMLISLRHEDEVVKPSELPAPEGRDLEKKELQMAEQLISVLEGPFDPAAYKDEFRERVLEIVATKAKGGKVKKPRVRTPAPTRSLTAALEASLRNVRREKASA